MDAGQVGEHFNEADHGERGGIDGGFNAGGPHAGSGAAEKMRIGEEAAEGEDEFGGVEITGGFTGGDEDFRHSDLW